MVHCRYNSYFYVNWVDETSVQVYIVGLVITNEKLHFSLICSFYYCLVKKGWALKVASEFAIRWLVAYESVAYKKI